MITLIQVPFFVLYHPPLHSVAIMDDTPSPDGHLKPHVRQPLTHLVQSVTGNSPVTSHSYWLFPHTPTHLSLSTVVGSIVWPEFTFAGSVNIEWFGSSLPGQRMYERLQNFT
jgi:hypothetical protein